MGRGRGVLGWVLVLFQCFWVFGFVFGVWGILGVGLGLLYVCGLIFSGLLFALFCMWFRRLLADLFRLFVGCLVGGYDCFGY